MFKNKTFNFTLIFSIVWHLFWMTAVGIVVTPTVQPSNVYQEVDFLGPILEKTAFDLMVEEVKPQAETLYAKSTLLLDKAYLRPRGPERRILKQVASDIPVRFAGRNDFVKDTKEILTFFAEDISFSDTKTRKEKPSLSVEGPAGEREIIFKPKLLTVPRGLYSDAGEYSVKLKFFVASDGIVYDLKPLVSSGYPAIDLQAIRFLKGWRFSPLSGVEKDESAAWGIVGVRIVAE